MVLDFFSKISILDWTCMKLQILGSLEEHWDQWQYNDNSPYWWPDEWLQPGHRGKCAWWNVRRFYDGIPWWKCRCASGYQKYTMHLIRWFIFKFPGWTFGGKELGSQCQPVLGSTRLSGFVTVNKLFNFSELLPCSWHTVSAWLNYQW